MITHYIYEIPNVKVGCTIDIIKRKSLAESLKGDSRYDGELKILEELHDKTDHEAGLAEWRWARKLGYAKEQNYAVSKRTLKKAASAGGKKGGPIVSALMMKEKRGLFGISPEKMQEIRSAGGTISGANAVQLKTGIHAIPKEERVKIQHNASKIAVSKDNHNSKQVYTCPHCDLSSVGVGIFRWHFDNCKKKTVDNSV